MAAAHVQHRSAFSTSGLTISLAFSSNNTAGNLLVYVVGSSSVTGNNRCTDNNSNTIDNAVNTGSGAASNSIDYAANCKSGPNTVSYDGTGTSGNPQTHLHIWEISGCVTTSVLGDTGTVSNNPTGSVSTSGTSTQVGDAVIGSFHDGNSPPTLTGDAGYSPIVDTAVASPAFKEQLSEFKAATSSGTQTATCTGNGTQVLEQGIATFIAAVLTYEDDTPPRLKSGGFDPNVTVWQ